MQGQENLSSETESIGGNISIADAVLKKTPVFIFNEDGSVNWRKMIPEEFLYVNKEYFERFNRAVPKSIEGLEDNQLLVKLGGIKHVAKLRGYESVDYDISKAERDHVVVKCTIVWKSEDFNTHPERYTGIGAAHTDNTSGFMHNFLEAAAENRAFVRAVRNYLNINIVGDDEIAKGSTAISENPNVTSTEITPLAIARERAKKLGLADYPSLVDHLKNKGASEALLKILNDGRETLENLSVRDLRGIIVLLNK